MQATTHQDSLLVPRSKTQTASALDTTGVSEWCLPAGTAPDANGGDGASAAVDVHLIRPSIACVSKSADLAIQVSARFSIGSSVFEDSTRWRSRGSAIGGIAG